MKLVCAMLLSSCLFSGHYSYLNAQVNPVETSSEDTKAIEAIVHSNPSDHVTEDVSFTNIFGTVRYGRAEFVKRHIEIANTIFKGTTPKSSIAKLRFVRQDVAIADVSGEITGFPKTPPVGVPLEPTGCCVSSCSWSSSKNEASGGSRNTTTSRSHLKCKRHFTFSRRGQGNALIAHQPAASENTGFLQITSIANKIGHIGRCEGLGVDRRCPGFLEVSHENVGLEDPSFCLCWSSSWAGSGCSRTLQPSSDAQPLRPRFHGCGMTTRSRLLKYLSQTRSDRQSTSPPIITTAFPFAPFTRATRSTLRGTNRPVILSRSNKRIPRSCRTNTSQAQSQLRERLDRCRKSRLQYADLLHNAPDRQHGRRTKSKVVSDGWRSRCQDGTVPFVRYVIRKKGEVELGDFACGFCHTRVMPDGSVLEGVQGNFPFEKSKAWYFGRRLANPADAPKADADLRPSTIRCSQLHGRSLIHRRK